MAAGQELHKEDIGPHIAYDVGNVKVIETTGKDILFIFLDELGDSVCKCLIKRNTYKDIVNDGVEFFRQ